MTLLDALAVELAASTLLAELVAELTASPVLADLVAELTAAYPPPSALDDAAAVTLYSAHVLAVLDALACLARRR
jgi:hypothetical protein